MRQITRSDGWRARPVGMLAAAALLLSGVAATTAAATPKGTAQLVHPLPARLLSRPTHGATQSTNWAGYAAQGATFTDAKGTWTAPAATCTTGGSQYSSFWVGIDGYTSNTVEQIGTDSDCAGRNRPYYYAWYEAYPAGSVTISSVAVRPGDVLSADVSSSGTTFTLTIANLTTGRSFSTAQAVPGAVKTSAEWITEAPSGCFATLCQALPLANFGTARFSGSYTTGNGTTASISGFPNDSVTMVTRRGVVRAAPSGLTPDGTGFSVGWKHS